ncbi:hypothetical protein Clacol_001775 [Clathrus columnatus]|uniref:DNA replication checkpoint mediator MRC1 domain-containing protein n=1 Tax=Clathrus columnatus TaxID=1419009 RepID=A0AAV5A2A8_9AGAM|nr:hypothetical protein Clacol_001775 [Clathrus columnatus]
MAPLEHADSIIEESVISTSPSRHVDTDNETSTSVAEPSLPRRVTKTYGRPKIDQSGRDNTENTYESRAHTLRTAPPDTERLVIPESEDASTYSGTSAPGFEWRKQLKQIDDDYNNKNTTELSTTIITPSGSFADENHKDTSSNAGMFDGTLSSLLSEVPHVPSEESDTENTKHVEISVVDSSSPDASTSSDGEATEMNVLHSTSLRNEPLESPPKSPLTSINAKYSRTEEAESDEKPKKTQKGKEKRSRKKASKKEVTEMQKESARLLADRTVEIKRQEQRPGRSDNFSLLQEVEDSNKSGTTSSVSFRHSTPRKRQISSSHEDPVCGQGGDADMPTADSVLETEYARLIEKKRAQELKEKKLQALHASKVTSTSSSDDDLEVERMVTPRSQRYRVKSIGNAPGLEPESKYKRDSDHKQRSEINLELAAKPLFGIRKGKIAKSGHQNGVSHQSLNQILLQRAEKQSSEIEGKKKEKWIQRGGSLKPTAPSGENSIDSWLCKGLSEDVQNPDAEEGDYEDEWLSEEQDDEQSDNGSTGKILDDNRDISNESTVDDEDDDEDKENQQPLPRRARGRVIADSDDENNPMLMRSNQPRVLAGDSDRLGIADSSSERGDDHQGGSASDDEDKENKLDGCSKIGFDGNAFTSNFESSIFRQVPRRQLNELDEDLLEESGSPLSKTGNKHRILTVLHEEDKENTFESDHSSSSGRAIGSPFSTPVENFEGSTLVSPEGFSQLFTGAKKFTDKEPSPTALANSPTPLLTRGFSQFFTPSGSKSQNHSSELCKGKLDVPFRLTNGKSFEFTQPNALLPSVQISESQRREVDNMFNKDQEFKLDEAKRAKTEAEPNSSERTKMPYFGSFIASPQTNISPIIRQPLATMSLTSIGRSNESIMVDEDSPPQPKRTRFYRERPHARSESPSPIAPRKVRNAFELLKDPDTEKHKRSIIKVSEFVEDEAQESDDELYAGFGGKEKDDKDAENEDQDAIVEGLVDDAELDEKTMAIDLVLEKHKEFEAQDDAAVTKLHQDAIEGKLRAKRKNKGLEFDDSESEDEDRRPKHFLKKRRIEGDTLDACAQNPETRPFFNVYQQSLLDDEDQLDMEPLEKESREDTSEDGDDDDQQQTVDISTVRDELRKRVLDDEEGEMARADLEDVTWVDVDDGQTSDDIEIQVEQEGMLQGNSKLQNKTLSTLRFNGDFMTTNATSQEKIRLRAWASQESQTRSAGGRGGFARREEKEKTIGSRKPLTSHKYPTPSHMPDKLKKLPTSSSSLISHVQKQKRFED